MVRDATLISFDFANETGVLANLGAALAVEDVDILGFTVCAKESMKTVHLVTEDQTPSLAMLDTVGLGRRSRDVLVTRLPGGAREVGEVGRRLADAGVNVEDALSLDDGPSIHLALAVDDLPRARKVLASGEPLRRAP